jgi:hypothetical protein
MAFPPDLTMVKLACCRGCFEPLPKGERYVFKKVDFLLAGLDPEHKVPKRAARAIFRPFDPRITRGRVPLAVEPFMNPCLRILECVSRWARQAARSDSHNRVSPRTAAFIFIR